VVVVDWSASSAPAQGRDSIWAARWRARGRGPDRLSTVNPATRAGAFDHVSSLLTRAARFRRTVLVAVDFSLGYPAGFAACTAGLAPGAAAPAGDTARAAGDTARAAGWRSGAQPWWRTWSLLSALVEDGPDNANNRFPVADGVNRRTGVRLFWGRPRSPRYEDLVALPPTDRVPAGLAPNPCSPLRITERLAGRGIKSNFQLFGGVTVGSQVMVGIPWLHRLLGEFRELAAVWPFETGFTPDPLGHDAGGSPTGSSGPLRRPRFVFAELWPSVFDPVPGAGAPSTVRDEAQVIAAAQACAGRDAAGWATWFDPAAAGSLPAGLRAQVLDEEGWILGIG